MILAEGQWKRIKRIRWDKTHSRRIQQSVHDDKLMVGWCRKSKRWQVARLVDATVQVQFGVKIVPTRETVPYTWKIWEDDDGKPLNIMDPRLIPYIKRCDLWRTTVDKYMLHYEREDQIEAQQEKSEEDELAYIAKHLVYPRIKEQADKMCGYVNRSPIERKWHVPQSWKPHWERTHDKAVA